MCSTRSASTRRRRPAGSDIAGGRGILGG
jgi:hypothetical protein